MCFNERPIKGYTSAAIDYQLWCFLFNLQQVEISHTVRAGVFAEDACVYAPLPPEVTPTRTHTHTKQACCSTDGKDHCSLRQRAAQQPAGVVSERQLANQVCSLSEERRRDDLPSKGRQAVITLLPRVFPMEFYTPFFGRQAYLSSGGMAWNLLGDDGCQNVDVDSLQQPHLTRFWHNETATSSKKWQTLAILTLVVIGLLLCEPYVKKNKVLWHNRSHIYQPQHQSIYL